MKLSPWIPLCALALFSANVFADEGDALKSKIKELEMRARGAKEQGHAEEAQELMQQVRKLSAELGEREKQRKSGDEREKIQRKIEELHQAGKHEEAEQLGRQFQEMMRNQGERERHEHAMQAIQHLRAAGLHEPAERIEQLVGNAELQRAVHEMQEQMGKMARAIEELRQQIGKPHAEGERRKDRE